jgi:hypothetical protein
MNYRYRHVIFSGQMMLKLMLSDEAIVVELWDEVLRRRQAKRTKSF